MVFFNSISIEAIQIRYKNKKNGFKVFHQAVIETRIL